jgi:nucleotide-binding universal stress UspA family protein
METILIPTDFSPPAKNAAMYALKLAGQLGVKKIVLYHSYEIPVTIDPLTPGIQMLDIEYSKENSAQSLDNFVVQIKAFANNIEIGAINEYGALVDGLDEVCAKTNAGLVVMGITGGGKLEEKLIGSNALSVAKHTKVPVIIVPAKTNFTRISSVMLVSDFDKTDTTIPVKIVRNIVEETKAKLCIFHVEETGDEEGVIYPLSLAGENHAMHPLLRDLRPEYYITKNKNFVEAVNTFVAKKEIDLIITVSRKHGFFENLFKESHTKMLAFHSTVPVMVVNG